jgi:hypothetical protein
VRKRITERGHGADVARGAQLSARTFRTRRGRGLSATQRRTFRTRRGVDGGARRAREDGRARGGGVFGRAESSVLRNQNADSQFSANALSGSRCDEHTAKAALGLVFIKLLQVKPRRSRRWCLRIS